MEGEFFFNKRHSKLYFQRKLSFHYLQKFSSDSSILNFVHSLLVIVLEREEEFDFSISNDDLEIISYFKSDPFTLLDLDLLANSYMIACTNSEF